MPKLSTSHDLTYRLTTSTKKNPLCDHLEVELLIIYLLEPVTNIALELSLFYQVESSSLLCLKQRFRSFLVQEKSKTIRNSDKELFCTKQLYSRTAEASVQEDTRIAKNFMNNKFHNFGDI